MEQTLIEDSEQDLLDIKVADQLEKEHAERKERNRLRSQAIAELSHVSPEKMKIALRRGERVVGYSGKLTYCGQELEFESDPPKLKPETKRYPEEAVKECESLSEKLEHLRKKPRLSQEPTYVSDDELPCCITQLNELDERYPGIWRGL